MVGEHNLDGRRILVVEDDFTVALDMCNGLRRHGATVLGPAPTPHYANLLMMGRGIDGAVLDIKLHGGTVYEFARQLRHRRVPFVFTTGTAQESAPSEFKDIPWLTKPVFEDALLSVIASELNGANHVADPTPARPDLPRPAVRPRPFSTDSQERWLRAIIGGLPRR
jgi:CheY-like chemotaxis protein